MMVGNNQWRRSFRGLIAGSARPLRTSASVSNRSDTVARLLELQYGRVQLSPVLRMGVEVMRAVPWFSEPFFIEAVS
jgi:hypothetical protein